MRRIVVTILVLTGLLQADPVGAQPRAPEVSITCDGVGVHTARLYRTLLGRQADRAGLAYWVGLRRDGLTGEEVAYWMTQGREYDHLYRGLDDSAFLDAVYHNLLGRRADAGGHAYWMELIGTDGRAAVVSWMTQTPEFAERWPIVESGTCRKAREWGLAEVVPGINVGRQGSTVTVLADRDLVAFDAAVGPRTYAGRIPGDVVVNANWFFGATPEAPVVVDGRLLGTADIIERGQLVGFRDGCDEHGPGALGHTWMGATFEADPCVRTAVSGISLIHKGERADAYPGIDLHGGYTNRSRSHSFIGYNDDEIVIIATRSMTASQLADRALELGVVEGVMLDGGGSTQIDTPTHRLESSRPVPAFAVLTSIVS